MEAIRPKEGGNAQAAILIDRLEGIVVEQIAQAADALEDWRDVLPEEFQAMKSNPLGAFQPPT